MKKVAAHRHVMSGEKRSLYLNSLLTSLAGRPTKPTKLGSVGFVGRFYLDGRKNLRSCKGAFTRAQYKKVNYQRWLTAKSGRSRVTAFVHKQPLGGIYEA